MDGGKAPAHRKATRGDWLAAALDTLVREGVEQVKILPLSERLGVSRSSFYWYFESRGALLDALITHWNETNTGVIAEHCERPARAITAAVMNLFRAFVGRDGFDHRLDFALREWARRDPEVRRVVDAADAARLRAVRGMFLRHGAGEPEADIRARILYFQQIGYYALELNETLEERLARVAAYVEGFTGQAAAAEDIAAFKAEMRAREAGEVG